MENLTSWIHDEGAILTAVHEEEGKRRKAEQKLVCVACDSEDAPQARVIALRYLKNPWVTFVDPETVISLEELEMSDNPRDREVVAEAEKQI